MGVFSLLIALGTAIGSWFIASEADKNKKALAEETIAFGKQELAQSHGEFLQTLGLQEEGLELQQEAFAFKKSEAAKDRIQGEKDRKWAKDKSKTEAFTSLWRNKPVLAQQMLGMWGATGLITGGVKGTPPAQPAPAGQGVFSANN